MTRKRKSIDERLEVALGRCELDPVTGCLVWPGATQRSGSGGLIPKITLGGRSLSLRRLLLDVMRPVFMSCGEERCLNVEHMTLERTRQKLCHRGHPLQGENVVFLRSGKRTCRICLNMMARERKRRANQRREQARLEAEDV